VRHADTDTYGNGYGYSYGDIYSYAHGYGYVHAYGDSYGHVYAYSYSNCYSHADAYTDCDGYSYTDGGNAYTDAHLRAGSVMGDCCTSAYCALRNQRSFRWYVLLFNRRL
jgi:hypothetical protein